MTPTMQQQAASALDSRLSAPVAVDLASTARVERQRPRSALVAQGIERRFPKPQAAGSNPAEGAHRFGRSAAGFVSASGESDDVQTAARPRKVRRSARRGVDSISYGVQLFAKHDAAA